VEKAVHATDWLIGVVMVLLALIAGTRYAYTQRFYAFLTGPGSNSYLEQHLNLSQRGKDAFTLLMELFFYPAASLLIVLWIKLFNGASIHPDDWILWLEVTLALALFFVVNNLLISLFAYLFNVGSGFASYGFQKMTYRQWALLFPVGLGFIAVFAEVASRELLLVSLILFVLLYLYGVIRSVGKHFSAMNLNMMHFMLYLCAFEIAPILIVFKWL
jgi:hypothetical protein